MEITQFEDIGSQARELRELVETATSEYMVVEIDPPGIYQITREIRGETIRALIWVGDDAVIWATGEAVSIVSRTLTAKGIPFSRCSASFETIGEAYQAFMEMHKQEYLL